MLQVAKKHAEEMPLESTLPRVAAAAKVSVSAVLAELQDLGNSCAQLHRLLESLSASGADTFVEVRHWPALDSPSTHHPRMLREQFLRSCSPCDRVRVPLVHPDFALMIIWMHLM